MNATFAERLCELNNDFYRSQAVSFSDTRHTKWPGWERCLSEASVVFKSGKKLHVLDVACGNLRFEEYLLKYSEDSQDDWEIAVKALDVCDELVPEKCGDSQVKRSIQEGVDEAIRDGDVVKSTSHFSITYSRCDIIQALINGRLNKILKNESVYEGLAHLTVSFGFMHHIPLPEWRVRFLKDMIFATKPGGLICVSFWRFMDDEGMAVKALKTHKEALTYLETQEYFKDCIDDAFGQDIRQKELLHQQPYISQQFSEGDYLLGWRNTPGAYRYCHSFLDEEIDSMVASVADKVDCIACFRADGRTGNLNEYLVLQVR